MKFLLVLEQEAGCDYTIGCGIAVHVLEAKNMDEIVEQIFPRLAERYGDPTTGRFNKEIENATLYAISDIRELDLKQYHYDWKEQLAKKATISMAAQDRADYERLMRKYGS